MRLPSLDSGGFRGRRLSDGGRFSSSLLGWRGNAHMSPLHIVSNVLILGGLILLATAWKLLYNAQSNGVIAVSGPYARIRHPQYAAFMAIMIGFLIQWPTLPTLAMFPILLWLYVRLARREEQTALAQFGEMYACYAENTPRFFPKIHVGTFALK